MSDFQTAKTVKTRKRHVCEWCGTDVRQGTLAVYRAFRYDGRFGTGYQHPECYEAICQSRDIEEFDCNSMLRGLDREKSYWLLDGDYPSDEALVLIAKGIREDDPAEHLAAVVKSLRRCHGIPDADRDALAARAIELAKAVRP